MPSRSCVRSFQVAHNRAGFLPEVGVAEFARLRLPKSPKGSDSLALVGRGLGSFGGCALFPEQSADLFP